MSFIRHGVLSALTAACVSIMGVAAGAADAAADRQAIEKGHEAYVAAMRASDCGAFLRVVADDAVFAPPNVPIVSGKAAVGGWCEAGVREAKTTAASASDRGVTLAGDWAIEHGRFDQSLVPVAGGGLIRAQGSFVAIWHRQADGTWKVTRDIWNSSQPASTR